MTADSTKIFLLDTSLSSRDSYATYRRLMEIARPLLARQLDGYEHYRRLGWLAPLLDRVLNLGVLERLVEQPISRAAADQRAGRAGREGPGRVWQATPRRTPQGHAYPGGTSREKWACSIQDRMRQG